HDVFSFRIELSCDPGKLELAVNHLAARHPILRTSFHLDGFSEPLQVVHRKLQVPFSFEDVSSCPPDEQEKRIVAWIETEKRKPFERTRPPLLRFHAQRLQQQGFQLFISFHHSCIDGWSLAAAISEVLQDYAALTGRVSSADSAKLEPPESTYRS